MDIRTKGLNHLCFPTYYRGPFVASNIANMYCTECIISRVRLFVHEAKRKVRIFSVSCRSAMNFVRGSLFAVAMRNSGSVWRSAFATTNSEGGMPGRMVCSQDPNESQTGLGSNDGKTLGQSLG